mmetsp:Transcript_21470/g.30084  ORF Transcript_21470/g.30084 Transcript_21470/m.30084 type:complete len:228 (-) Transcript_21470:104-787(-)
MMKIFYLVDILPFIVFWLLLLLVLVSHYRVHYVLFRGINNILLSWVYDVSLEKPRFILLLHVLMLIFDWFNHIVLNGLHNVLLQEVFALYETWIVFLLRSGEHRFLLGLLFVIVARERTAKGLLKEPSAGVLLDLLLLSASGNVRHHVGGLVRKIRGGVGSLLLGLLRLVFDLLGYRLTLVLIFTLLGAHHAADWVHDVPIHRIDDVLLEESLALVLVLVLVARHGT